MDNDKKQQEGTLSVDIYYKDNDLVIIAPVAGASLENISVMVENDILIIKGERRAPESVDDSAYEYKECFWGPFSRTIVLPRDIDYQNVKAYYHNGILMIRIPKKTETEVKRIEINIEG